MGMKVVIFIYKIFIVFIKDKYNMIIYTIILCDQVKLHYSEVY